jgi:hypothetical protein
MNTSTHTLSLRASRERAFDFLSRIDNLPKWATAFCRKLNPIGDGRYKVITPQGEIFFRIRVLILLGGSPMSGSVPSSAALARYSSAMSHNVAATYRCQHRGHCARRGARVGRAHCRSCRSVYYARAPRVTISVNTAAARVVP